MLQPQGVSNVNAYLDILGQPLILTWLDAHRHALHTHDLGLVVTVTWLVKYLESDHICIFHRRPL